MTISFPFYLEIVGRPSSMQKDDYLRLCRKFQLRLTPKPLTDFCEQFQPVLSLSCRIKAKIHITIKKCSLVLTNLKPNL